jgi:hypothetical protein
VVVFLLALFMISSVALSVVVAFALPHLRAGSPVLTDRGERVARRLYRPLDPVTRVLLPRTRPLARFVCRAARPLVRAVRPWIAPLTEAISRAVEEGSPAIRR